MVVSLLCYENIELAGGKLVLSPQGVDQVLAEIEAHLKGR
ncbi:MULTISPECIES: hypothetical protein [Bacillus]|nr:MULTISPECIES: hypothetical protein [Bacillus cereus group]MDF9670510.1 hypothetical protein [Bacillus paranthracis]MDG1609876.1 hypothetical protein [Bacillus paranthracis]MEC1628933.1 hypothetical protein [Bacillus paranthracis]